MAREGGCPLPHSACCDSPGRRGAPPPPRVDSFWWRWLPRDGAGHVAFSGFRLKLERPFVSFCPARSPFPGLRVEEAGCSADVCVCVCWRLWIAASPATSLGSGENPGNSTAMRPLGCWGLGVCCLLSVCQSSYACSVHKAWRFWLLPPGGTGRSVSTPCFCKRWSRVALL